MISRINGQEALGIDIKKQSDANSVDMSQLVMERLEELKEANKGIELEFHIASDISEFTLKAANAVLEDLGLAVILVSLVMLIFLHSVRNSSTSVMEIAVNPISILPS